MASKPLVLALVAAPLLVAGVLWISSTPAVDPSAPAAPAATSGVARDATSDGVAVELAASAVAGASERAGVRERTAAAVAAPPAPPTGVVVVGTLADAATAEPLPEYALELVDARDATAGATTADDGTFEADRPLEPGPLRVRFLESSHAAVDVGAIEAVDPHAAGLRRSVPLALRVASGPTYAIAVTPGSIARADVLARLHFVVDRRGQPLVHDQVGGKLGSGAASWVRFSPLPADLRPEANLVVDSRDGAWHGWTVVGHGPGLQPGVVVVALEAYAALQVTVQDRDGVPQEGAVVEWIAGGATAPLSRTTRADGQVAFEQIAASAGTLRVAKERFRELEQVLAPASGERTAHVVRLFEAATAGPIAGAVVSDTGRYERAVRVALTPQSGERRKERALSVAVAWTGEPGARIGRFRFERVTPGPWRVAVVEDDWFPWDPRAQDVEAPIEAVELRVRDSVAAVDLRFEPYDQDGQRVRAFHVRISSDAEEVSAEWSDGVAGVEAFPLERPLRWRLDAPGFATAFGDWSSFEALDRSHGRERRVARPALEKGLAQMFRVVRADDGGPIDGVVALTGGREAGRTESDGRVVVRAETAYERVEFRREGWRAIDAAELAPPTRGSLVFERTIRMEPTPP